MTTFCASDGFLVGSTVEYLSTSYQQWIPATVIRRHHNGTYDLDCRAAVSPEKLREVSRPPSGYLHKQKQQQQQQKKTQQLYSEQSEEQHCQQMQQHVFQEAGQQMPTLLQSKRRIQHPEKEQLAKVMVCSTTNISSATPNAAGSVSDMLARMPEEAAKMAKEAGALADTFLQEAWQLMQQQSFPALGQLMTQSNICLKQPMAKLNIHVGCAHDIGRRPTMEDEFVFLDEATCHNHSAFIAVYDGHGGRACVDLVKSQLHRFFLGYLRAAPKNVSQAFHGAFRATDEIVEAQRELSSGCTACCCFLRDEGFATMIHTAHVGDARAVLCRGGLAKRLTCMSDHKPTDPTEAKRIMTAGGAVINGRVNGILAVARALGDHCLKAPHLPNDAVSNVPHITSTQLEHQDEFIIVACDGLWDVMTDQEAVTFARTSHQQLLRARPSPAQVASLPNMVAKMLVKEALDRGTSDNVTCSVIYPRDLESLL